MDMALSLEINNNGGGNSNCFYVYPHLWVADTVECKEMFLRVYTLERLIMTLCEFCGAGRG